MKFENRRGPAGSKGAKRARRVRTALVGIGAVALAAVGIGLLTGFHVGVHPLVKSSDRDPSIEFPGNARVGIRTVSLPGDIPVTSDLPYGTAPDGTALTLDVCSPPAVAGQSDKRPAVVAIHGGSWAHGDKASSDWRTVCRWLASEGFVTYTVDYRLVPAVTFPAAIDDVSMAVEWMREPANVKRFGIDPAKIGVFGGSAGGNLAALLGMRGSGPTDTGSRVAAVAELSGPVDLTANGQKLGHPIPYVPKMELTYLGCTNFTHCPQAKDASPVYDVDPSDPPVFIGQSSDELIPHEQGDEFARALDHAHVQYSVVTRPGSLHSIAILDASMRSTVAAFLHRHLG